MTAFNHRHVPIRRGTDTAQTYNYPIRLLPSQTARESWQYWAKPSFPKVRLRSTGSGKLLLREGMTLGMARLVTFDVDVEGGLLMVLAWGSATFSMTLVATGNLSLWWSRVDVDGKIMPEASNLQRDNSSIFEVWCWSDR
jgi:hypothetical protein